MTWYGPGTAIPEPMRRPTTVTAASRLLFGAAGLNIVIAVITFAVRSHIYDRVAAIVAMNSAAGVSDAYIDVNTTLATFGGFSIAGVVVLGLFGVLVLRPRQGVRVTAIVFTSISLAITVCFGFFGAGLALDSGGVASTDTSTDVLGTDPETVVPTWFGVTTTVLEVLSFLLVLAVLIMLCLRTVSPFYRSRVTGYGTPGWPYPVVAAGYPATYPGGVTYPGGAQYPGTPYPGAQYPGAPYPGTPYPGAPYPGAQYPGTPYPGVTYPDAPYPGAPYPGTPYPGAPYQPVPFSGVPSPGWPSVATPAPYASTEYTDTTLQPSGSTPTGVEPIQAGLTSIEPPIIDLGDSGSGGSGGSETPEQSPWEPPVQRG